MTFDEAIGPDGWAMRDDDTSTTTRASGRGEHMPVRLDVLPERPKTRGECVPARTDPQTGDVLPCPWVSCRYHLGEQALECDDTCALDVADRGGVTLEEISPLLGVTRERVRQIEEKALQRMMRNARLQGIDLRAWAEAAAEMRGEQGDGGPGLRVSPKK